MTGYTCKRCPLAFEIGWCMAWDCSCVYVKYICRYCGTMHESQHREPQPDSLYAMNGPILAMEIETFTGLDGQVFNHPHLRLIDDWRLVGSLPIISQPADDRCLLLNRAKSVDLNRLSCANCGEVGGLISNEWPLDSNGKRPVFGENCPVCDGRLIGEYVST